MQVTIIKRNQYHEIKLISNASSFANVYKAKEEGTGKEYAIKEIRGTDDNELRQTFLNEIEIIAQINYPTLLKLHGITFDFPYWIITEFLPNNSVQHYIDLAYKGLSQDIFNNITRKFIIIIGITLGMRYLHSKNIAHRDLKPDNILL